MVEFKDKNSPMEEGFDNRVFIVPAIIVVCLVAFVVYKLTVSVQRREQAKKEKRLRKLEKKR